MRFSPSRPLRSAFSLVELIIVIAIIGIIALFVVPAANTIIMGSDITRSAQALTGQLALARQTAVTRNHPVEVRFLRFADPEIPGESPSSPGTWKFRAVQLMEVFDNGTMALVGKVERMPGNVIMDPSVFSSLLDTSNTSEPNQKAAVILKASERTDSPPLPRLPQADATKYEYVAFRFLPDGSTNLEPSGNWYVTLYSAVDVPKVPTTSGPLGINYFTAQVEPASGGVRTYRPTAGAANAGGTAGGGGKGT